MTKQVFVNPLVVVAVAMLLTSAIFFVDGGDSASGLFLIVTFVFVIVFATINLITIYLMWNAIQDEDVRMDPAKAIAFLFIPVFNLYWVFQVWNGFCEDYNSYIKRNDLPLTKLDEFPYHAFPLLMIMSVIPFLGIIFAILNVMVFIFLVSKTCDAVNSLDEIRMDTEARNSESVSTEKMGSILNI